MIRTSRIVFALFFSVVAYISSNCAATNRVLEEVSFNGQLYSINTNPLEFYWSIIGKRPELRLIDTSVGDYKAKWAIDDDKLMLESFYGFDATNGSQISVETLFPGKQKAHASWFTGVVLLAEGRRASDAWNTRLARAVMLAIENGSVVKTEHLTNKLLWPAPIGLKLKIKENKVVVESITPDSPADLSKKFQVGDELVRMSCAIWGEKDFKNKNVEEVIGYIRGIKGTSIHLFKKSSETSIIEEVIIER